MASSQIFVDTNILVYAHDRDAADKHQVAKDRVAELWLLPISPAISVQVLQELYVNLRRKASSPLDLGETLAIVEDLLAWEVHDNAAEDVVAAIRLEERYGVPVWDALVLQAANARGAEILYTEDLNDGQVYGEVRAVNPFS